MPAAIRILFAWLLLAALPLQGFAAATTLLCGPAHHGAAAAAPAAGLPGHHHAAGDSHDHPHDHASAAAPHGATPTDAFAAAVAWDDAASTAGADSSHSCSLCSAACHGLGLASRSTRVELASAPQVPLTEPFQRFDSRPAPVPDKPPRA